jgi:hypothetical protein
MKKFNKIFVCGISRTGTKSLGQYLTKFNLKTVHHGGRLASPIQINKIDVLLDDKQTQFAYEVLNQQYPNSLFIYTNRNTNEWVDKIISWKTDCSYIYSQLFNVDNGVSPDTKETLIAFKEEHFSRFQLFANKLTNDRVLYLDLEDKDKIKAKKITEFLGCKNTDNVKYPNIKYR